MYFHDYSGINSKENPELRRPLLKIILIMKLTTFFMLAACLHVHAEVSAQNVTLSEKNTSIEKLFTSIKAQTGYLFFYDEALLEKARPVTIQVKNAPLERVLEICFRSQPITYRIIGRTIVVKQKDVDFTFSSKPLISTNIPEMTESASQQRITGKVTDANGNPLEGVSVMVIGTNNGTATDKDGFYSLEIEDSESTILEFSSVGFKSQKISVKGNTVIDVKLKVEIAEGEEVIVTGFQNIPVQEVTGAFKVLDSRDLHNRVSSDVVSRLQGLIPGLQVDKDLNITIRGRSTFYGDQKPLVVIDGFPTENGFESLNPSSIEKITVLEDASAASIYGTRAANGVIVITTKDAKFGDGLKVDASVYRTVYQRPDINDLQLMNSSEYVDLKLQSLKSRNQSQNYFLDYYIDDPYYPTDAVQEIYIRHLLSGNPNFDQTFAYSDIEMKKALDSLRAIDGYSQINKYLLRNSIFDQYNISLRNGGANNKFYASIVYNNDRQMRIGNSDERFIALIKNSLNINNNISLEVGANTVYKTSKYNSPLEGNGWDILDQEGFMPFNAIIDKNGKRTERPQIGFWEIENKNRQGYLPYVTNPLTELEENDNTTTILNTRLNVGLNIKLLKGLVLYPKFQYERNYSSIEEYYSVNNPKWSRAINTYTLSDPVTGDLTYQLPLGGRLDGFENNSSNWTHRTTLSYNRTIKNNNRISFLTGIETNSRFNKGNQYQIIGYDPDALTTTPYDQFGFVNYDFLAWTGDMVGTFYPMLPQKTETKMTDLSYFGNGAFSYQEKYNLSASFRLDKASIFGLSKAARNNLLWSVGLSWNLHREQFFRSDLIDLLKVRVTYGINGNRPDSKQTSFLTGRVGVRGYGNPVQQITLTNPANPELSPEKVGTFNWGIDYEIFDRRVFGSLDYYIKNSENLIGPRTLDPTVGWTQAFINYARAKNNGITANINVRIVDSREFKWTSLLNFSYNKNKVVKADIKPSSDLDLILPFSGNGLLVEGQPIERIYAYKWGGLDEKGEPQIINEKGEITHWSNVKYSGFNDLLLHPRGATVAPVFGGFQNTFRYKDAEFGFLLTYEFGNKMRAPVGSKYALYYSPLQIEPKILADRWRNPGDEKFTSVPAFSGYLDFDQYDYYDYYRSSNINVLDASYIRLSNLFFNYDLPKRLIKKAGLSNLTIRLQAKDLWLWAANDWGVDPDARNNGALFDDIPSFPRYRSFVFGFDVKL